MISSTNFGFCSVLVSTIVPLSPVMVPPFTLAGVVVAPVSLSVSLFAVAVLPFELPALSVSLFGVASAVTTYVLPLIVMVPPGATCSNWSFSTVPSTMRYT